jgi:flagellin-like hook-associated protein FlgL
MTNADDVLLAVSTRLESIDNSLQSVVSLLESINGRVVAIATDTHTNTQQLATVAELRAMS